MSDKPILFSAPMIRALLAGRKTQTRRIVPEKTQDAYADYDEWCRSVSAGVPSSREWEPEFYQRHCKYAIGDRLWVREAWRTHEAYDDLSPSQMGGEEPIEYRADGAHRTWGYPAISKIGRPRPSMFMPRWASRLTLEVTGVRVERLQDISEADAMAEGVHPKDSGDGFAAGFQSLWNSIHGPDAWDENPWVCALTFTVHHCNIDAMGDA